MERTFNEEKYRHYREYMAEVLGIEVEELSTINIKDIILEMVRVDDLIDRVNYKSYGVMGKVVEANYRNSQLELPMFLEWFIMIETNRSKLEEFLSFGTTKNHIESKMAIWDIMGGNDDYKTGWLDGLMINMMSSILYIPISYYDSENERIIKYYKKINELLNGGNK